MAPKGRVHKGSNVIYPLKAFSPYKSCWEASVLRNVVQKKTGSLLVSRTTYGVRPHLILHADAYVRMLSFFSWRTNWTIWINLGKLGCHLQTGRPGDLSSLKLLRNEHAIPVNVCSRHIWAYRTAAKRKTWLENKILLSTRNILRADGFGRLLVFHK